ncbi:MAG: NAD-glutamate dehydrogenase [Pseudomonadota bacterium]|uniref:Glutamate dehydrogenase n=1 Tax=Sphingobium xenophagum TaxID=121428 RepID=A0A249MU47_SPHXE|nr:MULTISPECIES: NAD-glutamate dehydrogenase domain-containing protein [Sphingobium]ASY44880.1 glutamate dehydrogenase [Sphingobium xenophagum]OUC54073.1 glutamate dehydrogenase [Sphingobium sp. GW456-12-10-14-TSB1]QWT14768.1 NAD-glutamate dehydrogenase [Sphingobium xenophagum]
MTALADANIKEVDKFIREALETALERGALPGEREGLDEHGIAAAAAFLGRTANGRKPGEAAIMVETLGEGANGRYMRIAIVNDDMPFLVDSIANALAAADITIHRLLHPVLSVTRHADGSIAAILDDDAPGARRESMIYMEADRADAKARRALEKAMRDTLADVRAAVADWAPMQAAMSADADAVPDEEGAALLRWFLARHFTQTGHELCNRDGTTQSQLGICTLRDKTLIAPASLEAAFVWFEEGKRTPLIIKSSRLSRIHRHVLLDLIIIPVREGREVKALSIHAGMWTSSGLSATPDKVPLLRSTLSNLMDKFGFDPAGHAGKTLAHALTALPHDITIGFDRETLERLALTFMSLTDRPRPKLALATSALARHLYAFVWLPRDELSTARRMAVQDMLAQASNGPVLSWSIALEEGGLALLRITLDLREGGVVPDDAELDHQLKQMVRGWLPAVEEALAQTEEPGRAAALAQRYAGGFPAVYRNGAGPAEAAIDIRLIHGLSGADDKSIRIYRNPEDSAERLRLKLYSHMTIALSEVVPAFENFGFRVIEEMTTAIDANGQKGALGHVQRFVLELPAGGDAQGVVDRADIVTEAIAQVLEGRAENDRFNELIVTAGLTPRSVVLFRALFRYLRQTGMAYGMATFAETLRRAQGVAVNLVALFEALHDPAARDGADARVTEAQAAIDAGLEAVTAIDEDRVLRLLRAVITATLRTNFFSKAAVEALAFKLDSAQVPGLPAPLPWREIWVYSPRVEGIHLRAGPVARGGLRWSDRRDDFRTEILGLMKAQRVKNAVIVPTGAKGGFYPKQLPNPQADRDAWLAEGTESYRIFIRALLSVTDNIVNDHVKHPAQVVVRDGDDPYFVVAADKGTATFSDVANGIALDRKFWLGDAFASGGSNGYDHKAMGITARGAWISVQRHFAEMGVDVQSEPISVVGCGDMSGDVFGNGMLLSKAIKLVAAFDHRHIFFDPAPDPARSWEERNRMFQLPRSSWDDYDKALISKGGGVFSRALKSITLTPEIQAILGVTDAEMEPTALISAILKAPADLLWFGGIGTYVKAAAQSHSDVGDPANDRLRVNAEQLRVKVIGEGANLGTTQAGRIAFSLHGGRINTDFIDNSAGVDCSDNEVNIKIALNKEMAEGRLPFEERNALLESMTDAVGAIVLEDNRLQALGLSIAENGGAADLASYVRLIETFEESGRLDRQVEGLAANDQLLRRGQDGQGLTRPELAVLLSTAKLSLQDAIEQSDIASDDSMTGELMAAFPPAMQEKEADAIAAHALRREIIATKVANRIVNRLGLIHPFEMVEEEGCSLGDMASAFLIAERLYDIDALWADIDAAEMAESARLALFGDIASGMRAQIADILRSQPAGTLPSAGLAALKQGVGTLAAQVDDLLTSEAQRRTNAVTDRLLALGAPEALARRAAGLFKLDGAVGIAALAGKMGVGEVALTRAFTHLGEAVGIDWVQSAAARMEPSDPWERLLISGVARDMQQVRLDFLAHGKGKDISDHVEQWLIQRGPRIRQFRTLVQRAKAAATPNVAMLAEIAGQARGLLGR